MIDLNNKIPNVPLQDILLVASPFIAWFVITFFYNLLKIPAQLSLLVKGSEEAKRIVQEITKLQIKANDLNIDTLENWRSEGIKLLTSIYGNESYYYYVFTKQIQDRAVNNILFNRKTLEMSLKNSSTGRIERDSINLSSLNSNQNIDIELSVLEAVKEKFIPYLIPIRTDR